MNFNESKQSKLFNNLNSNEKAIFRETKKFAGLGAGMIGILLMLPESITKWEDASNVNLVDKWKKNVKEGPVIDKDDWFINYIGHPVSGMAYHVRARKAGLNKWESFGYSVIMSTFFWEYGLEAFAETPSIQDLIITPVVGSLMGELAMSAIKNIEENGGELWGSKRMGSVALGVMDPAGAIVDGVNNLVEKTFLRHGEVSLLYKTLDFEEDINNKNSPFIGVKMDFIFD